MKTLKTNLSRGVLRRLSLLALASVIVFGSFTASLQPVSAHANDPVAPKNPHIEITKTTPTYCMVKLTWKASGSTNIIGYYVKTGLDPLNLCGFDVKGTSYTEKVYRGKKAKKFKFKVRAGRRVKGKNYWGSFSSWSNTITVPKMN